MDTKTLCLGALALQEASGYEIKKLFESTYAHFQGVGFGSIYPALAQLSEQGYVRFRVEPQARRPSKKVFSITDAGLAHFKTILSTATPAEHFRSDFLFLLIYAHLLSTQELERILDRQTEALEAEIAHLLEQRDDPRLTVGMRFTLDYGITAKQARADFIRSHRDALLAHHAKEPTCE